MMSLERWYRRLMFAYPASYRAVREDEMVDTFLQTAEEGQTRPSLRDVWDLTWNGLGVRTQSLRMRELRAGRTGAALIAMFMATLIASVVLSLGQSIDSRPVVLLAVWAPHVVLLGLFAFAPVKASGRAGWILVGLCAAGVVLGSSVTLTARLLTAVMVVCELIMVAAPVAANQRTRIVVSRCVVLVAGVAAGLAVTSRIVGSFPSGYERSVATLWGGLPYPTGGAILVLVVAAVIVLSVCIAKPSVAVAVGVSLIPAAIVVTMLIGNDIYLTPTIANGIRAALGVVLASALTYYGVRASIRSGANRDVALAR